MPVRFLLDEQLRGLLWRAVERHNLTGPYPLDVVRVGDPGDLPGGAVDPDILLWAEREGRILVSEDRSTMRTYFDQQLQAGRHSPGLFLLRPQTMLADVVEFLVAVTYASAPEEWIDTWRYIP